MEINVNKINVYLIKETHRNYDAIIKSDLDNSKTQHFPLRGNGRLYYKPSTPHSPGWLSSYFNSHPSIDEGKFLSSSTSAVHILQVMHYGVERWFAITFGTGRFLLNENSYVERFGLITAVNVMETGGLRQLDKKRLASNTAQSREQVAKAGSIADFEFDFDNDLVEAISGNASISDFGNVVTGKDALSVSIRVDLSNIKPFLVECFKTFSKKKYKKNFSWIDKLKSVRDQSLVDTLNDELLKEVKIKSELVVMAIPEIIDWTEVAGFKYSTRKKDRIHGDLFIEGVEEAKLPENYSVEDLQSHYVSLWKEDANSFSKKWSIFQCLHTEIELRNKKYILTDGKWFEVSPDFLATINRFFNDTKRHRIALPDYHHKRESNYNNDLANTISGISLDAKNLVYGGAQSKIEFADVITVDKKLFYVKKYAGSSVLSHLFNQGVIAGQLLIEEKGFRQKLRREVIPNRYQQVVPINKPDAHDYRIVFVIIKKGGEETRSLPFFSKIALRNSVRNLERVGFKVNLNFVPNSLDEEEEE